VGLDARKCHPGSIVAVFDFLFGCDARVLDARDFDRRFYHLFIRVFPERTHVSARFLARSDPGNSQTVTVPLRGLFSDLNFHGAGERQGNLARHVDPDLLGLVDVPQRECLVARRLAQIPGGRRLANIVRRASVPAVWTFPIARRAQSEQARASGLALGM